MTPAIFRKINRPMAWQCNRENMFFLMGGAIATCLFSILIGFWNPETNMIKNLMVTCFLALVLLFPILHRLLRGTFDPFEPIVAFAIMYGVFFVVRPLTVILSHGYSYDMWFEVIDMSPSYTKMLLLALFGAVAFMIGYESNLGSVVAHALPIPPGQFSVQRLITAAGAVTIFGLFLYGLHLWISGETIFTNLRFRNEIQSQSTRIGYLASADMLLLSPALVLMVYGIMKRHKWTLFLGSLIMLTFGFLNLVTGNRLPVVLAAVSILVFVYIRRNRRPALMSSLLLLSLLLIGSSYVLQSRMDSSHHNGGSAEVFKNILLNPAQWFTPITEGVDNQMSDMFALALQVIPEDLHYEYGGATIGEFFVRPIPRAIWADKPLIPNKLLTQTMFPQAYDLKIANPEFTILTHFFLDFGFPGVLAGMFGYGILSRSLFRYFQNNPQNIVTILYLGIGFGFVAFGLRHNPVDNLVRWSFMAAPAWFIFWFGQAPKNDRYRVHADVRHHSVPINGSENQSC